MKKFAGISNFQIMLLIIIALLVSGCAKQTEEKDLIVKVDINSIVRISEKDVLSFFDKNKDNLRSLSDYLLANEKIFGTRPVILNSQSGIVKIQDESIKNLANKLIQEGTIKNISSLNDSLQSVRFLINYEYGVYEQGIRYVSDKRAVEDDKTKYNYVKEYKDLGSGWYYYLYYYNRIKDEDVYRKLAWDKLGDNDRKSVTYDWDKAIVALEDWEAVGYKTGKTKSRFVVSVCFNTEVDGLLGPIIMYFDPATKEVIGGSLRL